MVEFIRDRSIVFLIISHATFQFIAIKTVILFLQNIIKTTCIGSFMQAYLHPPGSFFTVYKDSQLVAICVLPF